MVSPWGRRNVASVWIAEHSVVTFFGSGTRWLARFGPVAGIAAPELGRASIALALRDAAS
eukprot:2792478-Rhodomonas_salina.1